jgi:hypothetical protein
MEYVLKVSNKHNCKIICHDGSELFKFVELCIKSNKVHILNNFISTLSDTEKQKLTSHVYNENIYENLKNDDIKKIMLENEINYLIVDLSTGVSKIYFE